MTTELSTNVLSQQHEDIGRDLILRVREFLSEPVEIKTYNVSTRWGMEESIELFANGKTLTFQLKIER